MRHSICSTGVPQAGTLFADLEGSPQRSGGTPASEPPGLADLSPQGQRIARVFTIHFLRDLLTDSNGEAQASVTCARHGIAPSNSIGIAVHHLQRAGLIQRVSFELSVSPGRKGGVERRWRIRDEAPARAELARLEPGR